MNDDYVLMMVILIGPILVAIIAMILRHQSKIKKYHIEKEHEKAVLERILSTVDLKTDSTEESKALVYPAVPASEHRIRMVCQKCGSNMDADSDKQMLFCPYCGAKEILVESDYVKEARINASSRERIAENKRQAANEIYEQYRQVIKTEYHEERKNKTHKMFLNVGQFGIGLILAALVFIAFIAGLIYFAKLLIASGS